MSSLTLSSESEFLKNFNLCIKGGSYKIETNVLDWERENDYIKSITVSSIRRK